MRNIKNFNNIPKVQFQFWTVSNWSYRAISIIQGPFNNILRKHIFRIFGPPYVSMSLALKISKNWHFLTPLPPYKCLRNIWMVPSSELTTLRLEISKSLFSNFFSNACICFFELDLVLLDIFEFKLESPIIFLEKIIT